MPDTMRRLLRIMLNAATVLSLLLCVAAVLLWVRNNTWSDRICNGDTRWQVESLRGKIYIRHGGNWGTGPVNGWEFKSTKAKDLSSENEWDNELPWPSYRLAGLAYVSGSGRMVVVPHLWCAVAFAVLPLGRLVRRTFSSRAARPGLCQHCGYDCRATPARCPECGNLPSPVGERVMPSPAAQTPTQAQADMPVPLDYAPRSLRPRHSFYSCASIGMAILTVAWFSYVQVAHPRYHPGGPLWTALRETSMFPAAIGLVLAGIGLIQNGRKRILSIVAIVVILLTCLLLRPPLAFA
jgi:hypothetical protein